MRELQTVKNSPVFLAHPVLCGQCVNGLQMLWQELANVLCEGPHMLLKCALRVVRRTPSVHDYPP